MITVTKAFLPNKSEYNYYLNKLWDSKWLTNNGEILVELEQKLTDKLGCMNLVSVNNGTIALQLAIRALNLKGEVITTPFSYVATVSSLVWEGCKPVFCDIDSDSLNIDDTKIESLITQKTSAILATHVYGNPCRVEEISKIACKYNLKVIYDAAHCFDVQYKNQSILNYGDISTLSFHATKIFHTVEGGAIITKSDETAYRLKQLRNFGHRGQEDFDGLGINGKQSEFHAAMGHCVLNHFNEIKESRKRAYEFYDDNLSFMDYKKPILTKNTDYNYAYYPLIFDKETDLLRVKDKMEVNNIFPRRYFYPSLTNLSYVDYDHSCPVSESIAKRALCLPLHHELNPSDLKKITDLVNFPI